MFTQALTNKTYFHFGCFLVCWFLLSSCQSSNVRVGGIPGVLVNTRPKADDQVASDESAFRFPRQRGQVKFNVELDRTFEPSPSPALQLVPKMDSTENLPKAIDRFNHDWNREARVKRLVR